MPQTKGEDMTRTNDQHEVTSDHGEFMDTSYTEAAGMSSRVHGWGSAIDIQPRHVPHSGIVQLPSPWKSDSDTEDGPWHYGDERGVLTPLNSPDRLRSDALAFADARPEEFDKFRTARFDAEREARKARMKSSAVMYDQHNDGVYS